MQSISSIHIGSKFRHIRAFLDIAAASRLFPRDGALAQSPLILPPEGAIIRNAVDDYLVSLVLAGRRPAFETVALPVARGLILGSDALWFISRGVVLEDLERGDLVLVPTDAQYLAGAVGLTRCQVGPDHSAHIASCAAPTPPASAAAGDNRSAQTLAHASGQSAAMA